jgi:large subunit ribosomal protein L9e
VFSIAFYNTDYDYIVVRVEISARKVKVTGPRGSLTKSFTHVDCDIRTVSKGRKILLEMWFASGSRRSCTNTICTIIQNMMVGVTKGYRYKMRFAYVFLIYLNFNSIVIINKIL